MTKPDERRSSRKNIAFCAGVTFALGLGSMVFLLLAAGREDTFLLFIALAQVLFGVGFAIPVVHAMVADGRRPE